MARKNNLKNTEATRFGNGLSAVENGRKGGYATAEANRQRKTARELAQKINGSLIDPKNKKLIQSLKTMGLEDSEMFNAAILVGAVFNAAANGDMKAYEKWLDLVGESRAAKESNDKLDALIEAVKRV